MKKNLRLAIVALIGIFFGLAFLQQQRNSKLRGEITDLRRRLDGAENLREENRRLSANQIDRDELERLRQASSELVRLRGEVGRMKESAKKTEAIAKNPIKPQKSLTREDIVSFSTNVVAELKNQETLVTGGWEITPGKTVFALITPSFIDAVGNSIAIAKEGGQITLGTKFVEFAMDRMDAESTMKLNSGRLSTADAQSLIEHFEKTDGVVILSSPNITTLDGRQSQVSVGETIDVQGEKIQLGPVVNFVPTISADGTSVSLRLQTTVTVGPK